MLESQSEAPVRLKCSRVDKPGEIFDDDSPRRLWQHERPGGVGLPTAPSRFRLLLLQLLAQHEDEISILQRELLRTQGPGIMPLGESAPVMAAVPPGSPTQASTPTAEGSQAAASLAEAQARAQRHKRGRTQDSLPLYGSRPSASVDRRRAGPDVLVQTDMSHIKTQIEEEVQSEAHTALRQSLNVAKEVMGLDEDKSEVSPAAPTCLERVFAARRVCRHRLFEFVSAAAILCNSVFLGVQADYSARRLPEDPNELPPVVRYVDYSFSGWFAIEVVCRAWGQGLHNFACGHMMTWNWVDLVIVCFDLAWILITNTFGGNRMSSVSVVRMLRVFRLLRAVRVIRLLRFCKELRLMVLSIMRSARSFFWSVVLIAMTIFVIAIWIMQSCTDHLYLNRNEGSPTHANLTHMFGSLDQAAYFLFMSISGGISWIELSDPLLEVHWSLGLVMCFYIFFTVFAMLNIITGIFVDTALSSAQVDEEEVIQEMLEDEHSSLMQLKHHFEEADKDKSQTITMSELVSHFQNARIRALLRQLGIEVTEAGDIFNMLDMDHSGEVTIEEFCYGLMRLKGGAKTLDVATLVFENRRMMERVRDLSTFVRQEFKEAKDAYATMHRQQEELFKSLRLPGDAD